MSKKVLYWIGGLAALGVVGIAGSYAIGSSPIMIGASFMNLFRSEGNPPGSIDVEVRKSASETDQLAAAINVEVSGAASKADLPAGTQDIGASNPNEWASYNRTVTSDRYSRLDQINTDNAAQLKVLCTFDTKRLEGSQTGLIMVGDALIGTTAEDTFSLNPDNCKENWLVHEKSGIPLFPVNRGATYVDGKIVRLTADGNLRAYDAKTGASAWTTFVGDRKQAQWFTSAPISWNGMIFVGTAGGDLHNVRGRIVGVDAATGKVAWQTFTVPKSPEDTIVGPQGKMPTDKMRSSWGNPPDVPVTGGGMWTSYTLDPATGYLYVPIGNPAPDFVKTLRPGANLFTNTLLVLDSRTGDYVKHYSIMPDDWHDWDMSNPPALYVSRSGRKQLSFHPKDGHLYSYDMATDKRLYRNPVTRVENADVQFEPGKPVRFCPGSVGGGEYNSVAYDPSHNLLFTGENEWCTTAKIEPDSKAARAKDGATWFGSAYFSPYAQTGKQDDKSQWAGWFYASDADTGQWAWRARTAYPIMAAVTPTAGGIVMFGDIGGNFYVLNAGDGTKLFNHHFEGALFGGIITYSTNGKQRIALMSGAAHPQWPIKPSTGKVVILGL